METWRGILLFTLVVSSGAWGSWGERWDDADRSPAEVCAHWVQMASRHGEADHAVAQQIANYPDIFYQIVKASADFLLSVHDDRSLPEFPEDDIFYSMQAWNDEIQEAQKKAYLHFIRFSIQRELNRRSFGRYSLASYKKQLTGDAKAQGLVLIQWPDSSDQAAIAEWLETDPQVKDLPRVFLARPMNPLSKRLVKQATRVILYNDRTEKPRINEQFLLASKANFTVYVAGGTCDGQMGRALTQSLRQTLDMSYLENLEIKMMVPWSYVKRRQMDQTLLVPLKDELGTREKVESLAASLLVNLGPFESVAPIVEGQGENATFRVQRRDGDTWLRLQMTQIPRN